MGKWIWYPGEYEIYHGQKAHLRRRERDVMFPAFWRIPETYGVVFFRREVSLTEDGAIITRALGDGFVEVKNKKYRIGDTVPLPRGNYVISVCVANPGALASFYADGTVPTDESWTAGFRTAPFVPASCLDEYCSDEKTPDVFPFAYREIIPVKTETTDGGVLYDFGEEYFARVSFPDENRDVFVSFGESRAEATDFENSLVCAEIPKGEETPEATAFRYIFVPGAKSANPPRVRHEYIKYESGATFSSSDPMLDRIWETAARTFELNSREFFFDGIKRDRWVWSGDAYQSCFVNRYLHFDKAIAERTVTLLGGKGTPTEHVNTINDYTFYFILSVLDHYEMTGDKEFVRRMWPRMTAYADFAVSRLDGDGFVDQLPGDWVFIDWADFDFDGPLAAEEILFWRAMTVMSRAAELIGEDGTKYAALAERLKLNINRLFWCEEKGAYIDSFRTGRKNVTRHANIFAVLFGFADGEQTEKIASSVLLSDKVDPIKTPYFKFFELSVLAELGHTELILPELKRYFGAMTEAGATTFWEQFDPSVAPAEQLSMYGEKYGKSLCHAWGATPVWLIGRYLLGVKPTSPGYASYEVEPHLDGIDEVDATVPVGRGFVHIRKSDGKITVTRPK